MQNTATPSEPSRRDFLAATAVGAASLTAVSSSLHAGLFASGSDLLKVGLIGCGGRGTGAAEQALNADPATELVALGDIFEDATQRARRSLTRMFNKAGASPRVTLSDDTCYSGFDNYLRVIEKSDVVLLATTPHFRPQHLRAAVEAGKHVFCEKPVAVDAPGVRSVMESSQMAQAKGLSLVSGLCWRYHPGKQATFEQIKGGLIGEIVSMQCSYMTGGVWDPRRTRDKCSSEMEYQIRNWYYYTWLSGDFNVEQHIHSLDKMMWAMNDEVPATISGSGGRQVRTDDKYGNIYDHFDIVYTWPNGVKAFARCRHWPNCENEVEDYIIGTKGRVDVMSHKIEDHAGNLLWKYDGPDGDMYQIEHNELFASIREGKPLNNGDYMCKSTMLAIAGRMAGYTGQRLTWDAVMNSKEDLTPQAYEWGDHPVPTVAIPGKTPFV
ncbi:MAG: Gfo/Idh/MocA family oxidoreductase [Planctomycetaceae bacterium]|nr:Gfo/Idh/MocA family oxidoreductase [Planctomycetaceae bacterium]